MPGMNVDRTAKQMRRIKPNVPILMLSGNGGLVLNDPSSVDAVLRKGESWPTVVSTLDRLLTLRFPFFSRWWEDWKHQLSE
jgi:hypothetical protein